MSRTVSESASREPKCTACGGNVLAPPTRLEVGAVAASAPSAYLAYVDDSSGLERFVDVRVFGSICMSCGHVMLFADPQGRQQLARNWHRLKPRLS